MENRVPQSNDSAVLTSPCDGTVYSISKVKDINHLFIVKKINYLMSDFLYGSDDFVLEMNNIVKKKHVYQMTIYLSPGDCHRYFSPGEIYVEKRVYIPGFLEPVMPSYITKHPNVFQTNERVTLQCKFAHHPNSLLYISFVGALNVGSISLNFDQLFQTNGKLVIFIFILEKKRHEQFIRKGF
jgi:phosphatidylserine decarboxylase precursor